MRRRRVAGRLPSRNGGRVRVRERQRMGGFHFLPLQAAQGGVGLSTDLQDADSCQVLQSASPPYPEIPRKLLVAKRLAQCLNRALPSGVHQRALDVYGYIFTMIGVRGNVGLLLTLGGRVTTRPPHLVIRTLPLLPIRGHICPSPSAQSV
jgi:hypothetical protein